MSKRFRVERAGAPLHGYLPGWYALDLADVQLSSWHPSWQSALDEANRMASVEAVGAA